MLIFCVFALEPYWSGSRPSPTPRLLLGRGTRCAGVLIAPLVSHVCHTSLQLCLRLRHLHDLQIIVFNHL